jgi:chemotaxis signal transduction protein
VSEALELSETAETLRRSFDRSFAELPRPPGEPPEDFLSIRVAGEVYAVRLAEVAGLYADRTTVPLPSPLPELLGIVSIRGTITPVYDLAALLGHGAGDAGRWLLLTGGSERIALAFPELDGHFRSARSDVAHPEGAQSPGAPAREVVRVGDGRRPILNLASLVETLTRRVRPTASPKER